MTGEKLTIFVIDDNRPFALTLRAELEKLLPSGEFEISLFENGEACQSKLYFVQPDLAIVDYHLDGLMATAMNGIETIRMIRNESPETDFIMITMDEQTELFLRSKDQGIYDYLTKGPQLSYKLSLSIQQWLKWRHKSR